MRVLFINKSDSTGGAAVVTYRLMHALEEKGVEVSMLVMEKVSGSDKVHIAASSIHRQRTFLSERLRIFLGNGFRRDTLFKIDTASDGLKLYKHHLVKEADVICLNWVNQGMLSFEGLQELKKLGKPIVWTMHDMWCFTGVCHHAGLCLNYMGECGNCPLYGKLASSNDPSHRIWLRKKELYGTHPICFVAVSHWLADLSKRSGLLKNEPVSVIHNAFPITESEIEFVNHKREELSKVQPENEIRLVMGAARLDDSIKGLPILMEALKIISEEKPGLAKRLKLNLFGSLRDKGAIDDCAVRSCYFGSLSGESVKEVYIGSDIVVSPSLYETLPGTLVEGQAYGCVPVCFNRGGQRDIVEDGVTGVICEFSDNFQDSARRFAEGIERAVELLGDKTRRVMAKNVITRFSASAIANQYITLFKTLLKNQVTP